MAIIEQNGVPGKVCRKCDEWQPLSSYSPKREHGIPLRDRYQHICKRCRSAAELQRYRADPEPLRAANRARYYEKRDERLSKMHVYRAANREKILAQKRIDIPG